MLTLKSVRHFSNMEHASTFGHRRNVFTQLLNKLECVSIFCYARQISAHKINISWAQKFRPKVIRTRIWRTCLSESMSKSKGASESASEILSLCFSESVSDVLILYHKIVRVRVRRTLFSTRWNQLYSPHFSEVFQPISDLLLQPALKISA